MNLFSTNMSLLEKGLNLSWKKSEIIANNIANAETPGYKTTKMNFEEIFKNELSQKSSASLKRTRAKHLTKGGAALGDYSRYITKDLSTQMTVDGNNVDMELEQLDSAKNTILYQTLVLKAYKEISKMRYVINEGRA